MVSSWDGRILIEFDQNHVVKRYISHKCKEETVDPICGVEGLWAMIEELLGKDSAAQYRRTRPEPIHEAVALGDLEEVKRLIAQGTSVDASLNGRTALQAAASDGQVGVVELLLADGADVNARDTSGATPLHEAAAEGHTAIAEMLIANGADVSAKDEDGNTPLHKAASSLHKVTSYSHRAIVELLIANGADVNAKNTLGWTSLHWAARFGGETVVIELLLANGADINAKDVSDRTPLHYALSWNHKEVAKLLKQHGAKE